MCATDSGTGGSTRRKGAVRGDLAAISLAMVVTLCGCGLLPREDEPKAPALPEPPSISSNITYRVERVDLFEQVEGTAVVTPIRRTELYFTRTGRIAELNAKEG